MLLSSEFLKLTVLDTSDFRGDSCYIHKLAIIAVLPDIRRGGTLLLFASGGQVHVKETVSEVMNGLVAEQKP